MLTPEWLRTAYKDVIAEHHKIWVAYSGGVDSHVLLTLAEQAYPNVTALHINHSISPFDDKWQQHCENVCAKLNIKLHVIKVTPTIGDKGPEAAMRMARRMAWQELLQCNDVLLVAHHAADQAETILYRLLRGAGPHGLGGMRKISKIGKAKLIRPLLNVNKAEILTYAKEHELNWIEDHTNKNTTYARNYLRNNVMPLLEQRWPLAVQNINRAGELCAQLMQNIQPELQAKLSKVIRQDNTLDLQKLRQENSTWQQQLLRAWLQLADLNPSLKQLELLHAQVVNARIDAVPEFKLGQYYIKRSNNKLYLIDKLETIDLQWQQSWDLAKTLQLPTGDVLYAEKIFAMPQLRTKIKQHNVTVRLGIYGRKAKKIFQDFSIPPWERAKYPLIFADERLICIVGLWLSPRF